MWTRRLFFGVLLVVSLLLSLASGFYATSRLFWVLLASLALAWAWARLSLRGVRAGAEHQTSLAEVGGWAEERLWVENKGSLPRPWVHIQDLGDVPGLRGRVTGLAGRSYHSWTLRTRCTRRGRFTWGPLRLTSGDPLGLFREERTVPSTGSLIVYPATIPLDQFVLSVAEQAGDSPEYHATSQITPNVVTIRRYVIGDSLSRIHWKSSAKLGRLMVKEFETETHGDIWLILDLCAASQVGAAEAGTEETAVTAAASLARYLLDYDNGLGFLAMGEQDYVISPSTGDRQLWRVLEALAVCRAQGRRTLREVLASQAPRFTKQTGLVVVTPSVQDAVAAGAFIMERSAPGAIVLLEPLSFGARQSALPQLGNLLASGVAVYVIRRGDDLARALNFGALGPAAAAPGARRSFVAPGRWGQ